MKEIHGSASAIVRASVKESYALLAAVQRYGEWDGALFRELEVLQHRPLRVRGVVNAKMAIELTVEVRTDPPHAVYITRLPNEPSDREELELVWLVEPEDGPALTRIALRFEALASFVPGFVPLGGVGDKIARKVVESAASTLVPT